MQGWCLLFFERRTHKGCTPVLWYLPCVQEPLKNDLKDRSYHGASGEPAASTDQAARLGARFFTFSIYPGDMGKIDDVNPSETSVCTE